MQSETFDKVCSAVATGQVHVSEHAYDEAVDDGLSVVDVLDGTPRGEVIELMPAPPPAPATPSGSTRAGWVPWTKLLRRVF